MSDEVLAFHEALAVVRDHAARPQVFETEQIGLLASMGRVLAEEVVADRDQPPFDRATRDGFAVRAEDFSSGDALQVIGQVRAGEMWTEAALTTGEAIEIMTGAPVPTGADAVVMVEHVEQTPGWSGVHPEGQLHPATTS